MKPTRTSHRTPSGDGDSAADLLAAVLAGTEPLTLDVWIEIQAVWRAASRRQHEAWTNWRAGTGSYEAYVTALDHEEEAAVALHRCHQLLDDLPGRRRA